MRHRCIERVSMCCFRWNRTIRRSVLVGYQTEAAAPVGGTAQKPRSDRWCRFAVSGLVTYCNITPVLCESALCATVSG